MNFEDVYGEIGHQYIEVHHLYPVCNMGENYQFDPLDEERGLVPLCSNCHSMIHRGGKIIVQNGEKVMVPMPLQALRDRIKVKKQI
jgi:5-methylcytosine-specific restriction protein A